MKNFRLITAIEAAYRAGLGILEVYNPGNDMEITYKSDDSPLTMADRRSHNIIQKALTPLGVPILSEEGRSIPFELRRQWKTFWLVDPLDGTKEFIKRNGEFTVNIALMHNKAPVMGVIYVPVKDELYFAAIDKGAFKISDYSSARRKMKFTSGDEKAILNNLISVAVTLPRSRGLQRAYCVVGSRSHVTEELEAYIQKLKIIYSDLNFVSAGSSLKFCLVAEGRADEYPRLGPTMEWDTAAGQIIAECAGAIVVDHEHRLPLRYNKASLLNPWFIVSRLR